MSEEIKNKLEDWYEDRVIHIGFDQISVYPNMNGDICIKQPAHIYMQDDSVICVPRLYVQTLLTLIEGALEDSQDG